MAERNVAISVKHVSKAFKLPHEKHTSIKSALINFRGRKGFEKQEVLADVSVDVKEGEFFGIVGRNGSGKSTLLKLLAGIYAPDKGEIQINGKLTPFIELGVGFNPELTGRENVFLNGALLGFNRKEMEEMYGDIVAFAELERFMDQKLKNYSSGMQVRLAFSIAIRAKSDILLIDEVLAVGDAAFQQKCFDIFADLKKIGTTIVLVTHDMGAVMRFCDRAMLVSKGKILKTGKPKDIADDYLELNYEAAPLSKGAGEKANVAVGVPVVTGVSLSQDGRTKKSFETGSKVNISLRFDNPRTKEVHFGLQIFNDAGTYCFGTNTGIYKLAPTKLSSGIQEMTCTLDLVPGTYSITVATMNDNATTVLSYKPKMTTFRIMKSVETEGVANLTHSWKGSHV